MPTGQEKKQYPHGKHPNSLANLKKGKRFGNGEGNTLNAREENKKSVAVRNGNKTLREFAIDFADKPMKNGITFKEAYIMRLAKMAADGNLAAMQYFAKLIGEDPGDVVTVKAPTLSDDAKADIDKLLKETRGEVK